MIIIIVDKSVSNYCVGEIGGKMQGSLSSRAV